MPASLLAAVYLAPLLTSTTVSWTPGTTAPTLVVNHTADLPLERLRRKQPCGGQE